MNLEPDLVLHTKIKEEEDDTSNIINLDLNKSPEDLVYEWNSKVRLKFKNYSVDSEQSLDLLMKWYITVIKEEAVNLEDFQNLKLFTTNHMQLLKLYFIELNCCFVDNYLDNMEEILLFYVNLELKSLPSKKKDGNKRAYKKFMSSVCQKIISLLNLYLLNRGDRMCHVVMKMKSNLQSDESKDLLNLLYGNFLTKRPKEKSDLEFCRAYILYQKWKTIRKSEDWEKMDEVMYNLHERTPDSIKTNPILKQILLPKNNSILDTLAHISEKHLIIAEEYFKYIKSNKGQEDNIMVSGLGDIEIQDDDIVPDLAGDSEDQEFEKAYKNFVKSMSTVCLENDKTSDECVNIKVESASEDEDCQIVSVTTLGNEPEAADVIHEILDDDEDDIEIIYLKKNSDKQNAPREDKRKGATLSFLESIEVVEARDVSTERVSSSTNNGCAPLPAATNLVETFSNTKVVIADSPTSSSSTENPLTEVPNSNVVTSITQTEPLQEVTSLESELNKLLSKTEEDSNHTFHKEKTTADVVAIDLVSESNPSPVKTKNVVSIETQTDDWLADDGQDKLPPIGKHAQQRSYYYYGLDTPPSDQPPDEHIPPTAESVSYPKVYANIVRTPSPNEAESLAKATETDSLSSLADDNDMDNNKSSPRTDDLTPIPVSQKEPCSSRSVNECNPSLLEAEFIPNVEPNTKKKWKKSSKLPEENADLINEPYMPGAGPSMKKKHKKLKKHSKHYPNLLDETFDEPNAKKKRKKLKKPSEDYGNLLEEELTRDVEPSTKKKRKKLNKSPERNRNLLDEAFVPEVESNRKKKHRKSSKQSDFDVVPSSQRNTTPRIRLNSEEIIHHNQAESASSEFRSNDTTRENCRVSAEEATTREHPTENVSSLGVSTSRTPADAYPSRRTNLRSPSPYKYTDSNICETSTNVPCTSLEFIVTSAESNVAFNEQSGPADVSNASPDVTSTSTDAQDFSQALCNEEVEENQVLYDDLSAGVLEIEEYAVNDESYCLEECVEYSDCDFDNVTQSNIEDVVEEGVLVEVPVLEEELPFVVDETPPVGANVNICSEDTSVHSHFPTDVDDNHKNDGTGKEKEKYHDQPSCCLKELKISVEKINLSPPDSAGAGSNSRKIMFTLEEKIVKPSADDYSNTPMRWKKLREAHDLDEAFSGPVSRINETNSCVNPDTNFDLFTDCGTSQLLNNSPGTSSSELTSPAFEGIEDFKKYYEENKNNPTQSRSRVEGENIATTSAVVPEIDSTRRSTNANKVTRLLPRTLESLQDTSQSSGSAESPSASVPTSSRDTERTRSKNVKRVHIAETIMDSVNSVPRLLTPVNAENAHLRGILKKSYVECQESEKGWRNMRISPRQMNSKSLRHYKVEANDALLQSEPCVCIKPITEIEISRWLSINEISRKVRLKKQTGCASPKSIKVDYNKQITSHISTNDMVQYTIHGKSVRMSLPEEFGQWRPNSVPQTKPSRLDEGLQELPYTEKKTGKRKRQNNLTMYNSASPKRGPGRPRKTL